MAQSLDPIKGLSIVDTLETRAPTQRTSEPAVGANTAGQLLTTALRASTDNVRTRAPIRIVNLSTDALAITAVTRAANAVFTVRNNLQAGETFKVTSVANMASLTGAVATVISATPTSIVTSLNTTGEAVDGGAGTATVQPDLVTATITAITQAKRAVITAANSFRPGTQVTFDNAVGGMTQIRGKTATVVDADPTFFKVDLDTTGYSAFTTGGTASAYAQNGRIGWDWDAQYWAPPAGYTGYQWLNASAIAPLLTAPSSGGVDYGKTAPFDLQGGIVAIDNNSGQFRSNTYYPPDGLTRGWVAHGTWTVETDDLRPIFKMGTGNAFYVQIDNGNGYTRCYDSTLGTPRESSLLHPSVRTRPGSNGFQVVRFDFRQAGGVKMRGVRWLHASDFAFSDAYLTTQSKFRKPVRPPQMFLLGDSLSFTVINGNAVDGFGNRLAERLGMEYIAAAEGGTGFLNNPGNTTRPFDRINLLASVTQYQFKLGVVALGHNDVDNSPTAAIVAEALRCIRQILSKWPGIKVVVFGPGQNGLNGSSANRIALDNALAPAIAGAFPPAQVQFKPIASATPEYVTPGGTTVTPTGNANSDLFYDWSDAGNTLDNVHGNFVYHAYIADRMHSDVMDALAKMQAAGG